MQIDVKGRVNNITLPASKPLLPLYEAIVNSIQAIEDNQSKEQGIINISVLRDTDDLFSEQDKSIGAINGFEVSDNGIGFTNDNFKAFSTSDTTFKASRGGKGVGRFLWLVAFKEVEIESHYLQNGKMNYRRFLFSKKGDAIEDVSEKNSQYTANRTTVKLSGFIPKYKDQCPKRVETISSYIIEYFLEYFIRSNCPHITLIDKEANETINLNDIFDNEIKANSDMIQFKIGNYDFSLLHVHLYSAHTKEHGVNYCANDRVVKYDRLVGHIPNLIKRLHDKEDREFVYAAYVEANMFDSTVNSERTSFAIAEDGSELEFEDISWEEIKKGVIEQCRYHLLEFTEVIKEKKKEQIENFIATEAPMYRPILKYIDKNIDMINPEISDQDLDVKLYEAYQEYEIKLKKEGQELLKDNKIKEIDNFKEYSSRLKAYFEKLSDINKSDLARYVCHRKAVIEFLQRQLEIDDDGKYQREERIHNIIFPMGKTSEEDDIDNQNLWLIDEKLVYHSFLASDKQLRKVDPLVSDSKKEPDIIVFDKACTFVPSIDQPFSSIVIIEFKRPMRDNYTEDENPFDQVADYIDDIRKGKAKTPKGRDIPITPNVPFFCFIVCDMNDQLEKRAKKFELDKTPDGQGYFGYKKHYHAYFEVLSFSKMVSDAKKRNAVFFDKLNLPK